MNAAVPFAFSAARQRGFTITELVAVLLIVAILAVTAASMFDRRTFDAASFTDQTQAQLAYAQKVAVAARRTVTVTVAGNTISLTMCSDAACGTTVPVPSPTGEAAFVRAAPSGVTIGPDSTFTFNALGGTSLGANLTLTVIGDTARSLVVEATTGYVHR